MLRGDKTSPSTYNNLIDKRTVKINEKTKSRNFKLCYSFKTLTSDTIRNHIQISNF